MLIVIAFILLFLWLIGVAAFHVTAWFFHIILIAAVIFGIAHLASKKN